MLSTAGAAQGQAMDHAAVVVVIAHLAKRGRCVERGR
jgi:hypothetical protein